jgi:hypothetical protein
VVGASSPTYPEHTVHGELSCFKVSDGCRALKEVVLLFSNQARINTQHTHIELVRQMNQPLTASTLQPPKKAVLLRYERNQPLPAQSTHIQLVPQMNETSHLRRPRCSPRRRPSC